MKLLNQWIKSVIKTPYIKAFTFFEKLGTIIKIHLGESYAGKIAGGGKPL